MSRSIRTLDLFLTTLVATSGGKLPNNFVVTLPKIVTPEQVAVLADIFDEIEPKLGLTAGSLKMEMMIETTQSIIASDGEIGMPRMLEAARGRCTAAHFGVYDYTASCSITAAYQGMLHPACDFARSMMQVSFGGTGVWLSDGATNIMPVAPHRGDNLTAEQIDENRAVVHRLEAALRSMPTLVGECLLPRLGSSSRTIADAICCRIHFLPRRPRRRFRTPTKLCRKSGTSNSCR